MLRPRLCVPILLLLLPIGFALAQQPPPETEPPPEGAAPGPTPTPPPPPQPASTPPPAKPAPQPAPKKVFWGGGIGASFGDVDYISVSPQFGWWLNPRIAAGFGLEYIHRKDTRTDPDLSTSDYGASAFSRVSLTRTLFVAAEYEYLRYERFATSTQKVKDNYSSVFVGGGLYRPMGGHTALVLSAMYNLSYSDNEFSPYDSPYIVTVGVSAGF